MMRGLPEQEAALLICLAMGAPLAGGLSVTKGSGGLKLRVISGILLTTLH